MGKLFLTGGTKGRVLLAGFVAIALSLIARPTRADWKPVPGSLMTKWAADVKPDAPLPEYPRPQMVRHDWQSLNGLWDYRVTPKVAAAPADYEGQILVPYPIESALSGVKRTITGDDRLWYHRTFEIPAAWAGRRVLLHFGAVDYEALVTVNGTEVARHTGGYDEFEADITAALKPGTNELIVNVYDATDETQLIGKQRVKGGGIFYTGCTGIWQTVWIEPVAAAHIALMRVTPDLDAKSVTIGATLVTASDVSIQAAVPVTITDDGREVAHGNTGTPVAIADPKPWSPDSPHLYGFHIGGDDPVDGYFAMRKISVAKDADGHPRIMLNNQFVFQRGVLDQGYWPDGIYTAPTDEALKSDIETTRRLGFNMCRKHAKVEPERWYYWADKLGLLVWQDVPQAFAKEMPAAAAAQYELEMTREIQNHYNHPSIIVWTTFNEGWGEHDVAHVVDVAKGLDNTRLVDTASGWNDVAGVGDIRDTHHYPPPWCETGESTRAVACGEFGGLGMRVADHMWTNESWGYQGLSSNSWHLTKHFQQLIKEAYGLRDTRAMSGYCYTQLTDVETESNGLMTYDRAVVKVDGKVAAAANTGDFAPMPPDPDPELLPTSVDDPADWKYTTDRPADGWEKSDFDDKSWKTGHAGFGHDVGGVNTEWKTDDIWLRREIDLPAALPDQVHFNVFHDEDVEIYVNGVKAASAPGFTTSYVPLAATDEGRAALKPGKNLIAVHCHQTAGGQFIDVGMAAGK